MIRVARRALPRLALTAPVVAGLALGACVDKAQQDKLAKAYQAGAFHPDEPPALLNKALPFRYPAALYAQRVQGNVTLRLYIDRDGHVHADSTRVYESSGYPPLDSSAVLGARQLQFVPAKMKGEAVAVTILFPVYFRHPGASPLPGDTILKRGAGSGSRDE